MQANILFRGFTFYSMLYKMGEKKSEYIAEVVKACSWLKEDKKAEVKEMTLLRKRQMVLWGRCPVIKL